MIVCKAFGPGLVCRGYKYHEGLNVCKTAKCVRDGFHAAENPLDCLDYYPRFEGNEFWLCEAGGDIDEDGTDSKIACTELTLLKRLDLLLFVMISLRYIADHPDRRRNRRVCSEVGVADRENHFVIVEGTEQSMAAKAERVGDVLGYHDWWTNQIYIVIVSGDETKPGVWYDQYGREVNVDERKTLVTR